LLVRPQRGFTANAGKGRVGCERIESLTLKADSMRMASTNCNYAKLKMAKEYAASQSASGVSNDVNCN
jgi:hypothetical protein